MRIYHRADFTHIFDRLGSVRASLKMKIFIILTICVSKVISETSSSTWIDTHFTTQFKDENVTYYSRRSLVILLIIIKKKNLKKFLKNV